ncbi:MAG TPA: hypothetical protein VG759_01330 [Candidatus Angelobacter sp.]|nr:hypothetical protein [Candidatus Angelobacter sp.]
MDGREGGSMLIEIINDLHWLELFHTLKCMEIQRTPDQKAIASGRLRREEDAVRERTRAEILSAVDEAEESLARGAGRSITEQSMRDLAKTVKQRGRVRLRAKGFYASH